MPIDGKSATVSRCNLAVLDEYGIELREVNGWHSDNCNGAVAVMHDELGYSSMQSVWMQSVCTQSVCTQSVCMQSVYMQSVCMQSVYMQSVCVQSVCMQSVYMQSVCMQLSLIHI